MEDKEEQIEQAKKYRDELEKRGRLDVIRGGLRVSSASGNDHR